MVPDGWEKIKLDQLIGSLDAGVSVNSGDRPASNEERGVLKTSCVSNGFFEVDENKVVSKPKEICRLKEPVMSDSIIISRMNTPMLVGANAYVENCHPNLFLPDRLWQAKPKNSSTNMKWLSYVLESKHGRHLLRSRATGTSGSMKNIKKSDVFSISVLRPPSIERNKIAKILTTWDHAIEATEKLIENSERQKKGLMQQLLTGKKRLKGFSGEWLNVSYGDVVEEVKRKVNWSDDETYNLISVRRRSGGAFHRESLIGSEIRTKNMKVANSGDFIVSKMQILHGASAIIPSHLDGFHISGSYISLQPKRKDFDIRFLGWISKTPSFYHQTYVSSYGVHIEKMTFILHDFLKRKFRVPPNKEEQSAIADALDVTEKSVEIQKIRLDKLKSEKAALMQQLLTGKRRVKIDGEIAA